MVGAVIAVAHLAQADVARLGLQLAIAVGAAGEAVERMVGNVELHHAAPELLEPRRLRAHDHAFFGGRRAGGGRSPAALDLDEAEPAGAEGFEAVGRAEFRDRIVDQRGGRHHRRPARNAHLRPSIVSVTRAAPVRIGVPVSSSCKRAMRPTSYSAAARGGALAKSSGNGRAR